MTPSGVTAPIVQEIAINAPAKRIFVALASHSEGPVWTTPPM